MSSEFSVSSECGESSESSDLSKSGESSESAESCVPSDFVMSIMSPAYQEVWEQNDCS